MGSSDTTEGGHDAVGISRRTTTLVASSVALAVSLVGAVPAGVNANALTSTPPILRAVCDNNNTPGVQWWCEPSDIGTNNGLVGFVRGRVDDGLVAYDPKGLTTEDDEINAAFELLGQVARFYADVLGVDLTQLIGFAPADGSAPRALSATVNACLPDSNVPPRCGALNAYWSPAPNEDYVGGAVSFLKGMSRFKDVVAHEMTHGVLDTLLPLRYQGESGAINEAIADIFGELADRYIQGDDEEPGEDTQWLIGEGVQWANGSRFLRSMADPAVPTRSARLPGQAASCSGIQPDRMTHPCWDTDPNNQDNGGVHTNSGVAAKIAYLMAMGGQFNGQTIRPAAADTRPGGASDRVTARIWFEVLQSKRLSDTALLKKGNDGYVLTHFELGRALMAACRALVGTPGVTKATCESTVAPAIAATEVVARQFTASVPKTATKNRSAVVSATVRTKAVIPRGLEGQKVTLQKFDPKKNKWVALSSSRTNASGKVSFGVRFADTTQVRLVLGGYDGVPVQITTTRRVKV
jgi:hypothetical protein